MKIKKMGVWYWPKSKNKAHYKQRSVAYIVAYEAPLFERTLFSLIGLFIFVNDRIKFSLPFIWLKLIHRELFFAVFETTFQTEKKFDSHDRGRSEESISIVHN